MFENLGIGFNILLTGVIIVFAVLVVLIVIIKLYSLIVVTVQNKVSDRNKETYNGESKKVELAAVPEKVRTEKEKEKPEQISENDGTVPGEIVAAIAAAIEVIFGEGNVRIKSIKKSTKRRSVWKSAGLAENTRSF